MHEGDMSSGFDETATAEKSIVRNVRGTPGDVGDGAYMRMKGNQIGRYQQQGSSQRSRIVGGCSHPLVPTTREYKKPRLFIPVTLTAIPYPRTVAAR